MDDTTTTILNERCPCDDCPLRIKCATQGLACLYFSDYVLLKGKYTKPLAPMPTRRRFVALFGGAA